MHDLTGGPDDRMRQLAELTTTADFDAQWLRRQLDLALEAWGAEETQLDVALESRVDY